MNAELFSQQRHRLFLVDPSAFAVMPRAALTHRAPAHVSKANRIACLSVTRFQIAPEYTNQADHIFTAPGKRNPKIPSGAWEKYISQFTVTAERKTARSGRKG